MNAAQRFQILFLTTALLLPMMALAARRISLPSIVKMAFVWVVIFVVGALLVRLIAPLLGYNLT